MKKSVYPILLLVLLYSCKTTKQVSTPVIDQSEILQQIMIGSYNSEAQSIADTSYYNISLHMYPIWQGKNDAKYLYVEQALNSMQDKPYRQRVYEINQIDAQTFGSKVYTLDTPKDYIGKWATPEYFDQFDTSILSEREGCTVFLKMQTDGTYSGSTNEKDCTSTLRGASYATSIVTVYQDKIVSWDQGYDSLDQQVWGS